MIRSRSAATAVDSREGPLSRVLRAASRGSLATALAAMAVGLWLLHCGQEWGGAQRTVLAAVGLALLHALLGAALVFPEPGSSRLGDGARVTSIALSSGVVAVVILHPWWQSFMRSGERPLGPVLLAAAAALTGTGWVIRLLRLIHHETHPRGTRIEQGGHDAGRTRSTSLESSGRDSGAPGRPLGWVLALGAFFAPAAALSLIIATALALLPSLDLSVHATVSRAEPIPDDALPTIPTGAPSNVAWTLEAASRQEVLEAVPGARGPIILSDGALQGLDGEDGAILWTYRVENDGSIETGGNALDDGSLLRISPDRRHVAFMVTTRDRSFASAPSGQVLMILDTMTGAPTVTRTISEGPTGHGTTLDISDVQLTDSAVLVGTEVLALTDGARLGALPDEHGSADLASGTAGHSTFALSRVIGDNGYYRFNVTLVPDSDLSASTRISGVCADPTHAHTPPTILNGWVLRCDGADPRSRRREAPVSPDIAAWNITALNVDDAAALGEGSEGGGVPMGRGLDLNREASLAAGAPVTIPERSTPVRDTGRSAPEEGPWIGSLLDTGTRTAIPAAQSPSIAAASFTSAAAPPGAAGPGVSLRITPANGEPSLVVPLPTAEVSSDWARWRLRAIPSPGCTVIIVPTGGGDSQAENGNAHQFTVVGLR